MIPATQFESCDHRTRLSVSENIASFSHESQPLEDLRAAAVAIVIAAHRGSPTILLTRRSGKLRVHSGQWALPGGRLDAGESAEDAAL
ncbi:MAG: NUDIX domain-containing protein, partial [Pseudomonadota bacterium]|nr:NUDIX domain-containing protein [Pseudomonadota bacterium]